MTNQLRLSDIGDDQPVVPNRGEVDRETELAVISLKSAGTVVSMLSEEQASDPYTVYFAPRPTVKGIRVTEEKTEALIRQPESLRTNLLRIGQNSGHTARFSAEGGITKRMQAFFDLAHSGHRAVDDSFKQAEVDKLKPETERPTTREWLSTIYTDPNIQTAVATLDSEAGYPAFRQFLASYLDGKYDEVQNGELAQEAERVALKLVDVLGSNLARVQHFWGVMLEKNQYRFRDIRPTSRARKQRDRDHADAVDSQY